jgi:hypothetical protein
MIRIYLILLMGLLGNQLYGSDTVRSWRIDPEVFDREGKIIGDQKRSLIQWSKIDTESWLDFEKWKTNRYQKDRTPNWKRRLRETKLNEIVGRVIDCDGGCKVFRGDNEYYARYQSRIFEGDEIEVEENSNLLIILIDGSLIRLSSNSHVSFNEVNLTLNSFMFYFRLSKGHLDWNTRRGLGEQKYSKLVETDQAFLPLMIPEANLEFYQRSRYKILNDRARIKANLDNTFASNFQNEALNNLIKENNEELTFRTTKAFLALPNTTLELDDPNLTVFHELNGSSWVRLSEGHTEGTVSKAVVGLRGYNNLTTSQLDFSKWYKVDREGRTITSDSSFFQKHAVMDLILSRRQSSFLAREIFLKWYGDILKEDSWTEKKLTETYGYRAWDVEEDDETQKRMSFLVEHIRRIETTNIAAVKMIYDKKTHPFDSNVYGRSMGLYLSKLKGLAKDEETMIRHMNSYEFYLWISKHAENKRWLKQFNWYLQANLLEDAS